MREWESIRYDDAANGDGSLLSQNTRYYVDGEMQRRPGLAAVSAGTLSNALSFVTFGDLLGRQYIVIAHTTGVIETVQV